MSKKVICFGEVLWDIFPEGEKIGGAPLNVALRLKALGISSSQINNPKLGLLACLIGSYCSWYMV